jgi:RHS repeat-associated protein
MHPTRRPWAGCSLRVLGFLFAVIGPNCLSQTYDWVTPPQYYLWYAQPSSCPTGVNEKGICILGTDATPAQTAVCAVFGLTLYQVIPATTCPYGYFCTTATGADCRLPNGVRTHVNNVWNGPFCDSTGRTSVVYTSYAGSPSSCTPPPTSRNPEKNKGCSKNNTGNPCNAATQNKFESATDYQGTGPFPLTYARYFNGKSVSISAVGRKWTSNYTRVLSYASSPGPWQPYVNVQRPDDNTYTFKLVNGEWTPDADVSDRLTQLYGPGGNPSGWRYVASEGDRVEEYSLEGRLLTITDRSGLSHQLSYTAAGDIQSVADSFGRSLSFTYDSRRRIATMTDPAGGVYRYSYDTYDNLTSVEYPDAKLLTYLYGETVNTQGILQRNAMTGIVDENGVRFATFKYDGSGNVLSTEHSGGVQKYSFYEGANGMQVTDPRGVVRTYAFHNIQGVAKLDQVVGAPCPSCGPANASYDVNGNPASEADSNGNLTCRTWDLTRNLETQRIEGLTGTTCPGTPVSGVTRTITTEWDAVFRLPLRIAEPKRVTTFQYDTYGNLISRSLQATTDVSGSLGFAAPPTGSPRTWTYTHTYHATIPGFITQTVADGPRTDVVDTTTYVYDSATGSLASVTNALGHVTTYSNYDAHGRPRQITDPNGLVSMLSYDARRRLTSRIVGGEATSYEYDGVGQLLKVTMPDGSYLSYTYDAAHRLTQIDDNLGNKIVYTLDAMGNRTKEDVFDQTATLVQKREREFNVLNRLIKDIGGANLATEVTQYGYDSQGNLLSVLDPLNHLTQEAYDGRNRLTSITDPNSGVVAIGYDLLDQVITVTDPRGFVTSTNRTGLGNLLSEYSPDTGTTAYLSYDAAGNPTSIRDQMYRNPLYTYDALNRVTFIKYQNSSQTNTTVEYDGGGSGAPNAKGRLTKMTDESGNTTWSYDAHGRATGKSQLTTYSSLNYAHTVSYAYDGAGHLSTITYPSGRVIGYTYDAAGRVSAISVGSTVILSNVSYHPFGAVKGFTWGSGAVYARTFDASGRIQSYTIGSSTRTLSFDPAGQIVAIQDSAVPGLNATYGYDNLGRLITYTGFPANQTYTYDANGNRTSITVGANTYPYTIASTSNRLSSTSGPPPAKTHSYDSTGNLVSWSSGTAFTYSARNRLKTVTAPSLSMNLRYNALGQRVIKATSAGVRRFVYDEAGHLLGEYSGVAALQEYVYLGNMPVATFLGNGPVHYVWPDYLDTPRLVTSTAGQQRWRWDSAAFGDTVANENPAGLGTFTFGPKFPGQYVDKETGISFNYYRDYDPQTGRYIQSDPIGLKGGINSYAYVGSNPLSYVDSRGLAKWSGSTRSISVPRVVVSRDEYTLESECKCGTKAYVTIEVDSTGVSVGAGSFRSAVEFEDSFECPNPMVFAGPAFKFSIGGAVPFGVSYSRVQLGGALSRGNWSAVEGLGVEASAAPGYARVVEIRSEDCCAK